jgi:UDP-N-acetylglucosamine 3-dehydrogenase
MKVGIIGCGGIAPLHIKVYKNLRDVEIAGLCDLNLERAKSLAARYKIPRTFADYWKMLETEELGLVDICTPVSTHSKIVCDVSKEVPAILVEKPMALTVGECEQMIAELKKNGSKLCIGHNQIFSPNILKAKSLVDSGKFDLFSFITTQKESFELLKAHNLAPAWNVAPEQRGIIWEVCCHLAYLQLHFLPDITEVYAVGGKVKYPVYDDFAVLLRTTSQRFGLIELSWVSTETDIIYELRDSSGQRLQIYRDFDYFLEKSATPVFNVGGVIRNYYEDQKRILQKWARFGTSYFKKRKLLPTLNLISTYIETIIKDQPSPVPPEQGKNTIRLLECIQNSLDQKKPVSLNN